MHMPLAVIGHLAALHRDDPALHLSDRFPVVRGHEHGRALHVDVPEQAEHLLAALGVQVARGLVGKQHLRFVHERARHGDPLLFAAGQLRRRQVLLLLHADLFQHLVGAALDLAVGRADHLEGKRDVLEDGLVGKEFVVLEHEPDIAPEIGNARRIEPEGVHALDDDLPLVGVLGAEEDLEQGGLARPARAGDEDKLALVHGKADVAQGGNAFVIFGHPVELDHSLTELECMNAKRMHP